MSPRLKAKLILLASFGAMSAAEAQTPAICQPPTGVPPNGITATSTSSTVTVKWLDVPDAIGYAVARRNPDGSCWSLNSQWMLMTSFEEPIPAIPGLYAYQVAVRTSTGASGISQFIPFTVGAPPSTIAVATRTFQLTGFTTAGTSAAMASRTFTTTGFTAVGVTSKTAARTFSTAGFTAAGVTSTVNARTFTTAGFSATGSTTKVASRTFTLTGFTASGTAANSGKKKP
jgi:hypothetical protein